MSDFSYILLVRNPQTKKLIPITTDDGETIAEFDSEHSAFDAADNTTVCKVWGYEVVEVDAP